MPHTMTRANAGAIRAVGLSTGALLLIGAGAMAISPGANPDEVKPQREVKVPDLPARQEKQRIYPDEIAEWIGSAYRHEFPDQTEQPSQAEQTPAAAPGSPVRLVGVLGAGERAMAIVGVNDQQLLLGPGESGPDFRIEEIHDDHIVMVRAGQRSEVRVGERQGPLVADIRPATLLGSGGGGVVAGGVQSIDRGRAAARGGLEDDRREREDFRTARQRDLEEQRRAIAAQRALEATGGAEDGNMPVRAGSGNGNIPAAGNGAANGPSNGPSLGGQAGGAQMRQSGARPEGGASNN
jgi:hypothetical protein